MSRSGVVLAWAVMLVLAGLADYSLVLAWCGVLVGLLVVWR